MKNQWTLIIGLLFAILIAVFSVVNVRPVSVSFLFTQVQMPLVLVILGSALIGAIISGSVALFKRMAYQKEIKMLKAEIAEKEELLRQEQLRIIPREEVQERDIVEDGASVYPVIEESSDRQ